MLSNRPKITKMLVWYTFFYKQPHYFIILLYYFLFLPDFITRILTYPNLIHQLNVIGHMIKYTQMYCVDIYISITTFYPKFHFFLHNLSKGCWSLVFHKINIWLFNTFWQVQPWGLFSRLFNILSNFSLVVYFVGC